MSREKQRVENQEKHSELRTRRQNKDKHLKVDNNFGEEANISEPEQKRDYDMSHQQLLATMFLFHGQKCCRRQSIGRALGHSNISVWSRRSESYFELLGGVGLVTRLRSVGRGCLSAASGYSTRGQDETLRRCIDR
ncbi:hypothetical protein ACSQ67_005544 [Phaseolus vulgaris]